MLAETSARIVDSALTLQQSTRHPVDDDRLQTSRQDLAIAAIRDLHNPLGGNMQCDLYKAMYSIKDMNAFASTVRTDIDLEAVGLQSLENMHDEIHNNVGGGCYSPNGTTCGTMYHLEVSAFDPIFWLHHAMVDRLLTMWQVLNPNSWITPHIHESEAMWTVPVGQWTDGETGS